MFPFGFQAQLDGFADSLHQGIQGFGLSMAAASFRNTGYRVTFRVALDDDAEFPWHFS
jgi:hypothetical protein